MPLYCAGMFIGNENWSWSNLDTYKGGSVNKMVPDDTQLTDHFEEDTAAGHVNWDWTFQADVVYH